ncbi:J domain-containing protein [Hymenobacter guriensis]|uniref:J domain-containing protein n=1 Tax=Hymenobacter guriensis TaxID=2793065 RepID=A0ABS0L745_9BACT|nr:J domain-containing protein [Hymenobacter guriensis]MBG8555182.1 J domain-containing protein [Hymenobacter guriensis]
MTTHYTVLEVGEQASATEIRRAYLRLVQLTHPDRTPDPAAHQRYLAVNEAYETLSDPIRRQRYDLALQRARQPTAAAAPPPASPDPRAQRAPPPVAFGRRTRIRVRQAFDYGAYAGRARRWCQILLLLPVLILADYFLLRRDVQAAFLSLDDRTAQESVEPDSHLVGTSHGHFITPTDIPLTTAYLQLRISPLCRFVFAARLPDGTPLPVRNGPSVLVFFSGLLVLLAAAGWAVHSPMARVNLAIIASMVALLVVLMLLKHL